MIGAIFSGLTGLQTHQTRINVIGNNLANVNTTGFKKSRVTFREAFSQVLRNAVSSTEDRGSINPVQVGFGTQLGSIDVVHSNGNIQITGNPTDLAIGGRGFFTLEAAEAVSAITGTEQVFTRAGNFGIDPSGNLIHRTNGFRVLGWIANEETGEIDASTESLSPIVFPLNRSISRRTQLVEYVGNLDTRAGQAEELRDGGTDLRTLDVPADSNLETGLHRIKVEEDVTRDIFVASLDGGPQRDILPAQEVTLTDAEGNTLNVSFGEPAPGIAEIDVTSRFHRNTIGVFDAVGERHDVDITFTKRKDAKNTWDWQITRATGTETDGFSGEGTIQFNESTGTFELVSPIEPQITLNPAGDASDLTFTLDFTRLTQFADISDGAATRQDGVGRGTLTSFSIGPTGLILGIFSNGVSQSLAQLAIADIPNPEGLLSLQDTLFARSPSSGSPAFVTGESGNIGDIFSGSLELSNVNLTQEFTNLIVSERGFQANSRVVTTADEILVESIGLKR